jgi:sialic acid synthase SpsE
VSERVTLLHCTSEYPADFSDVNLHAMDTIRRAFDVRVGLSDHTPGVSVAIAATALGASVIEKHFTVDRDLEGPDHQASLGPDELAALVRGVREVEARARLDRQDSERRRDRHGERREKEPGCCERHRAGAADRARGPVREAAWYRPIAARPV